MSWDTAIEHLAGTLTAMEWNGGKGMERLKYLPINGYCVWFGVTKSGRYSRIQFSDLTPFR